MHVTLQEAPIVGGAAHLPIHQQPAWTSLNRAGHGQTYLHFQVEDRGRTVARGLIRLRKVLFGLSLAVIQRGPMTATPSQLGPVLAALEKPLRQRGVIGLTVNPYWIGDDVSAATDALVAADYAQVPQDLQNFPSTTAICDLTQDDDTLMAQMSQTGRRHMRKALKAGVTCRPMASAAEAKIANDIMVRMAAETGLVTDSQHDFSAHFEYVSAQPDAGSCLVTCLDGSIFGAAVNYVEGNTGYNMLIATRSDVAVPRAYVLTMESMRALRALGCTRFDMVGFPDERTATGEGAERRGAFKRSFGPQIVPVLPLFSKSLRPTLFGPVQKLQALRRTAKAHAAKKVQPNA